jgi:hypothetical protein
MNEPFYTIDWDVPLSEHDDKIFGGMLSRQGDTQ